MNKEVKCPSCGSVISMDGEIYDSVVRQIRNAEFEADISRKEQELKAKLVKEIELIKTNKDIECKEIEAAKDKKINELEKEISDIKLQANSFSLSQKGKFNEALLKKDKEISDLRMELSYKDDISRSAISEAIAKEKEANKEALNERDIQIISLKEQVARKDVECKIEKEQIASKYVEQISELKAKMLSAESAYMGREATMKDKYEGLLKVKEEELDFYKDFKSKQSVKLLGESLEEHCMLEFETIRALMPNCQFGKDNVVSATGSKGDFIFRDFEAGEEYISIMFDMKNEADDSVKKHKNEDFFKKLDKDRKEKGCEYAILVSTLEPDNDMYNRGIVSVSHLYEKMYVVRPQFFIAIISLLRTAARDTLEYRTELTNIRNENIDISNFEGDLSAFKDAIFKSVEYAGNKKDAAIKCIDKIINMLQQVKDDFIVFDQHMKKVENKADKLSIKKITSNAPLVAAMFDELIDNPA